MKKFMKLAMIVAASAVSFSGYETSSSREEPENDRNSLASMVVYGFHRLGPMEVDTLYYDKIDGGITVVFTGKTNAQKKRELRMYLHGYDTDGDGLEVDEMDDIRISQLSKRSRRFSESVHGTQRGDGFWDVTKTRQDEWRRTENENFEIEYEAPEEDALRAVHDLMLEFDGLAPIRPQKLYIKEEELRIA